MQKNYVSQTSHVSIKLLFCTCFCCCCCCMVSVSFNSEAIVFINMSRLS
jgi:hypothetical protein